MKLRPNGEKLEIVNEDGKTIATITKSEAYELYLALNILVDFKTIGEGKSG